MDVRHYRTDLFPEIEPYASGRLPLGGSHLMYWEQSGNPRGTPILFLHGGPGAGAAAAHRRFFDPRHYRIVIFDQRGCGRSARESRIMTGRGAEGKLSSSMGEVKSRMTASS